MLEPSESLQAVEKRLGLAVHVKRQIKRQVLERLEGRRYVLAGCAHQIRQQSSREDFVNYTTAGIVLLSF